MKTKILMTSVLGVFGVSLALASSALAAPPEGLRALDGEWIYVEDRTKDRPSEQQQPSMSAKVRLRVEEDALILVRRDAEIRIPLNGSTNDVAGPYGTSRYRGEWKDGAFTYESVPVRNGTNSLSGVIRTELRVTAEGLLAHVAVGSPATFESVALYRHPQDIALPTPAKATMGDMAWLAGAWVAPRGAASVEERWGPPLGGAMLGTSRTVARDKMVAFEFLRFGERNGGLVLFAQPNGVPPTEFVLTELSATRAVFQNPRHDSPQRIVYERTGEGRMSVVVGFGKGGRPKPYEFTREGN
jgi:hypothetical protein